MAEPATIVSVDIDDALADVLDRLHERAADRRPVELAIPSASALFLTAAEFRALKEVTDRDRLELTVRTGDPLRLQLARMLRLPAAVGEEPTEPRTVRSARPTATPRLESTVRQAAEPAAPIPPSMAPPPRPLSSSTRIVDVGTSLGRAGTGAPAATDPAWPRPVGPPTAAAPTAAPVSPSLPAAVAGAAAPTPETGEPPTASPDRSSGSGGNGAAAPRSTGVGEEAPESVGADRSGASGRSPRQRLGRALPPRRPPRRSGGGPGTAVGAAASETGGVPVAPVSIGTRPDGTGAAVAAGATPAGSGRRGRPASERRPWIWANRLSRRSWAIVAVAIVAVVAISVVVGAVFLPRAEVSVVLNHRPVEAEFVYDVGRGGEGETAVAAEPGTVEVVFDRSIPTTGSRTEPQERASSSVRLVNPTAERVTVDRGTVVTVEGGQEFAFADDVAVPAAGEATGEVRALEPGASGNVETGAIGGRLASGVYYSNRDGPAAGGTARTIKTVAPEDLESLLASADAAMPKLAEAAFAESLPAGRAVLPSSIAVGAGSATFDREVGDDAATVRLRDRRRVTALIYDAEAAAALAGDGVRQRLAAEAPNGYLIDEDSIERDEPEAIAERADGGRFRVAARAEARADLSADERRALTERLAGVDPRRAEAILAEVPEFERFAVAYRPGWLPDRMPDRAGRIEVEARD